MISSTARVIATKTERREEIPRDSATARRVRVPCEKTTYAMK